MSKHAITPLNHILTHTSMNLEHVGGKILLNTSFTHLVKLKIAPKPNFFSENCNLQALSLLPPSFSLFLLPLFCEAVIFLVWGVQWRKMASGFV